MFPFRLLALGMLALSSLTFGTHAAAAADLEALDRIQAVACQEGLPLTTIRLAGQRKLQLRSAEPLAREAFLRRASLLAYVAFKHLTPQVVQVEFDNAGPTLTQHCRVSAADLRLYLADGMSKADYDKRLGYMEAPTPAAEAAVPVGATP